MAIEELAEEVATNLEEAAEVTRKLNTSGLGYLAVGLGFGAAIGFYFGYKFNREKIRAEAFKDAELEVTRLRELYLQKSLASVNMEKPPVEAMVEERGYAERIEYSNRVENSGYSTPGRPLPAPVPIQDIPADALDDLPDNPVGTSKSKNAKWNHEQEVKSRTPDAPYVIHQNEYNHSELGYDKVVYTYWAIDDVISDSQDDHPIPNGDIVVGVDNLKFGHGSDDTDVVFVRNDRLELDMQICKVDKSFEEEVLGLNRNEVDDDDDDDDDDS